MSDAQEVRLPPMEEIVDYAQKVREAKKMNAEECHAIATATVFWGLMSLVQAHGQKHVPKAEGIVRDFTHRVQAAVKSDPDAAGQATMAVMMLAINILQESVYGDTVEEMRALAKARGQPDPLTGEPIP